MVTLPLRPFARVGRLRVQTEDRNGDGRPDVWHFYNARGRLVRIERDTNFDGRPNQIDEFVDGHLVRRELDRNFDGRVDLVEEFDAQGHAARTIVDVNFDGTANVMVLAHAGRPVLTRIDDSASRPPTSSFHSLRNGLLPLYDPFLTEGAWIPPPPSPLEDLTMTSSPSTLAALPVLVPSTSTGRLVRAPSPSRFDHSVPSTTSRGPPTVLRG